MSNRRKRGTSAVGGSLEGMDQNELLYPGADLQNTSTSDFANAGYSSQLGTEEFRAVDAGRISARPVDIAKIHPDAAQPRRAIPSSMRHYWNGSPDPRSIGNLFQRWLDEIQVERGGKPFDLEAYLSSMDTERAEWGEESDESLPQIGSRRLGAKEAALMPIVELASSIARDGLLNPISVAQFGPYYVIETGERRWLAYQLLHWQFPDNDIWGKIPARQVESIDVWRQAGENNARSALNAIARARQLARIIITIFEGKGVEFQPFKEAENEQAYYAQVSEGEQYRIPKNLMEAVLNATGLSSPTQVRQYRQLLRLPNPVWLLADDLNWAQNKIERDILQHANTDEEKLQRAYVEAKKEGYSVSILTLSSENGSQTAEESPVSQLVSESKYKKYLKTLQTMKKAMNDFPTQQRDALLDQMETIVKMWR